MENIKRSARETGNAHLGPFKKEDCDTRPGKKQMTLRVERRRHRDDGCSGSMGEFKKYIARRSISGWCDSCKTKYDNVEIVFISHHTEAKEVIRRAVLHAGRVGRHGRVIGVSAGTRHQSANAFPAQRLEHLSVSFLRRRQLLLGQRRSGEACR